MLRDYALQDMPVCMNDLEGNSTVLEPGQSRGQSHGQSHLCSTCDGAACQQIFQAFRRGRSGIDLLSDRFARFDLTLS